MESTQNKRGKILGVSLAVLYSLYYASTPKEWHFIDNVDLIFHEAGHTLFIFFGQFICVLMGSGFQILLPLSISIYFFYQHQPISSAICFMWTGMNVINVSVYAGDALAMQLALLGGDSSAHDWNYILSTINALSWTPQIAATLYEVGIVCIGVGIAYSVGSLLKR